MEPDTLVVEEDVEAALEDLDEETGGDAAQLAELLAELAQNPLDVNSSLGGGAGADPGALATPGAEASSSTEQQLGSFASLPELRSVPGITEAVYLSARPYLTVGPVELEDVAEEPSPYPPAPSFREARRGSPVRSHPAGGAAAGLRARLPARTSTSARRTASTRASRRARGGRSRSTPRSKKTPASRSAGTRGRGTYGYDYFSAHVALRDAGRIKALVLGDYIANFGQGVVLWRSSAFGKGREPVRPVVREGRGILPYGSVEENRFLRGAAATVAITPSVDVSAFASRRRLDASFLEPDTTDGLDDETRRSPLALHDRTAPAARPSLTGRTSWARASLVGRWTSGQGPVALGVVGYHNRFDDPIAPGDQPYERFDFTGQRATMVSALRERVSAQPLPLRRGGARAEGGAVRRDRRERRWGLGAGPRRSSWRGTTRATSPASTATPSASAPARRRTRRASTSASSSGPSRAGPSRRTSTSTAFRGSASPSTAPLPGTKRLL